MGDGRGVSTEAEDLESDAGVDKEKPMGKAWDAARIVLCLISRVGTGGARTFSVEGDCGVGGKSLSSSWVGKLDVRDEFVVVAACARGGIIKPHSLSPTTLKVAQESRPY